MNTTYKTPMVQTVMIEVNAVELFAATGGGQLGGIRGLGFVPGGKYMHCDGRVAYCVDAKDGGFDLEDEDGNEVSVGFWDQWTWRAQYCN